MILRLKRNRGEEKSKCKILKALNLRKQIAKMIKSKKDKRVIIQLAVTITSNH